jgi:hypothetical protein
MRCVDVVQELAVPTSKRNSVEMAEHLAACPRCATEAARSAQLDRLWDASRPDEPTSEQWDALWADCMHRLDHPELTPVAPMSRPRGNVHLSLKFRRYAAVASIVLAQAAAILIAVFLTPRPDQPRSTPSSSAPITAAIVIEAGQHVVIARDAQGIHLRHLPWDEAHNGVVGNDVVDPYLLMLNAFEGGMDFPMVASAE